MLKALYDYGVRNGLALPPGFVNKQIRAYIRLTADGDYLGLEQCEDELLPCPDIGSLANSPDKCNLLAEKCSIILFVPHDPDESSPKHVFFCVAMQEAAKSVPALAPCLAFLQGTSRLQAAEEAALTDSFPGGANTANNSARVPIRCSAWLLASQLHRLPQYRPSAACRSWAAMPAVMH